MSKAERNDDLRDKILNYADTGEPAKTKLYTDDKVLARVTDGIYRQPGSALRELISNAYDADAENVIIETDVPRFNSMTIRDDGNGMSVDTLLNLISHIGGSAKRSSIGGKLNVTSASDVTLSPVKNRKLIGKIGIGLFSVAQLTRQFEIITKQRDSSYYLRASISLHNYSDELPSEMDDRGESFETGDVDIWIEETENIKSHGTDIILKNIKKSARDILKSVDIWGQKNAETDEDLGDSIFDSTKLVIPKFHIGSPSGDIGEEYFSDDGTDRPSLPWADSDDPETKFKGLYDEVLSLTKTTVNPRLDVDLDHYLNMLWTLSLSVPLNYINGSPFHLNKSEFESVYTISNQNKGKAEEVEVENIQSPFSSIIDFNSEFRDLDFNVIIDGIQLFRPIDVTKVHESTAAVKQPLLFFGSYSPDFSKFDKTTTGGDLKFDAYILWTPKVIPKDHNGVLIRVHNSSGILFDSTFMKHQVAEHTIKSQLMIEIFVSKGLDSALNIDRESFNVSHPHYQILKKWLHEKALRQVINQYKKMRTAAIKEARESRMQASQSELDSIVNRSLEIRGLDYDEKRRLRLVGDDPIVGDYYRIKKEDFEKSVPASEASAHYKESIIKAEAMLQILDSYGLLDRLSTTKQDLLFKDILRIIGFKGA